MGSKGDVSDCLVLKIAFVAIQSLNHALLFVTPWTAAHQASLSFTISGTREWLLTPVFLPRESHGHRRLEDYSL